MQCKKDKLYEGSALTEFSLQSNWFYFQFLFIFNQNGGILYNYYAPRFFTYISWGGSILGNFWNLPTIGIWNSLHTRIWNSKELNYLLLCNSYIIFHYMKIP